METERKLVEYICESNFGDIPPEPLGVVKNMVLVMRLEELEDVRILIPLIVG